MKLFFFWTVTLLIVTNGSLHAWPDPTKGGYGVNLSGKMFTLSRYNGGLFFYSPYHPPPWASPTPYQTRGYTSDYYYTSTPSYTQTNTGTTESSAPSTATGSYSTPKPTNHPTPKPPTRSTTYFPFTTALSTRGVSVCLRYITDSPSSSIFTLSPSRYPQLRLDFNGLSSYMLTIAYSNQEYLQPNIQLWSGLRLNMWTSICLTLDTMKGVAQMFRDSDMSARKLLTVQYEWSGEPAIDFSSFEGQLTEVQMWDYPLSYKEVLYYMSSGYYGPYQGSVLNWSDISYSLRGKTLLEDSFEKQMRQPTFKRGRGRHLKGKEKRWKLLHVEENKDNPSYLKKESI